MDEITALTQIDFSSIFISVFIILIGIKVIVSLFEWMVDKLGLETKWMRKKREDHDLLVKTSQNLSALQERHSKDVEESISHDKRIKEELHIFMDEMRDTISITQNEIKQFTENRVHDRDQSRKIQKELTDAIKIVTDSNIARDIQIDALMEAERESLADKINSKYKQYISMKGIPEDEYDEFVSLHTAYKKCKGNHSGDAKYEYCINHLPVVPVEIKLMIDKEK